MSQRDLDQTLQMASHPKVSRQTNEEEDVQLMRAPTGDAMSGVMCRRSDGSCAGAHASVLNRAPAGRVSRSANSILQLQRQYGNQYVQRVLHIARQADGAGEVQPAVEASIQRARGGGQALDSGVRARMEPAFGADFSGVRVHTGGEADSLNRSLSARAFTTGQDIFFRQGEYSPGTTSGQELLAHELTHVVQQTGSVQTKLTVGAPDDEYEREADQVAGQVMRRLASPEGADPGQAVAAEDAQAPSVRRRLAGPRIQGAWTSAGSTSVTNSGTSGLSGDHTEAERFLTNGVWGKVWAHQNAAWYNTGLVASTFIHGATTSLYMLKATQFTFRHDGRDTNYLELTVSGNLHGSAKAEDLHFGKAGAAVVGFTRVRTPSSPTPTPTQLFVIKDGGKSSASLSTVADIEISIPFQGTTTTINIPLKGTNEGEASPFSESLTPPHSQNVAGTVGAETFVDVYLAARIEADADVESETWGQEDTNWAEATATYSMVSWRDLPSPRTLPSGSGGTEPTPSGGAGATSATHPGCAPQAGYLFRSMKRDSDDLPLVEQSARGLGVRSPGDIDADPGTGMVHPNDGGMSVTPDDPAGLQAHRKPRACGGTSPDSLFAIPLATLQAAAGLAYRRDNSRHGTVMPKSDMQLSQYRQYLAATRASWTLLVRS